MSLVYIVIWSSAVILALSAVWALIWAIRTGQFQGLRQGAASIFDDEEPVGLLTDGFPPKPQRREPTGLNDQGEA